MSLLMNVGAHMCAFSPLQRGGVAGSGTPGASVCVNSTFPSAALPTAAVLSGQDIEVALLKNFDYYYAAKPGSFSVSFGKSGDDKLTVLASVDDTAGERTGVAASGHASRRCDAVNIARRTGRCFGTNSADVDADAPSPFLPPSPSCLFSLPRQLQA